MFYLFRGCNNINNINNLHTPCVFILLFIVMKKTDIKIQATDLIKVEKNLETLGFFIPSSKSIKDKLVKKSNFSVNRDGKKLDITVTISSTPEYGLPITSDFDMYRAFQKLLHLQLVNNNRIENPVKFKTNQLIRLMGKENIRSKELYNDVSKWLKRMVAVTIDSQGVVFNAGKKEWRNDTFHVFERVVLYGEKADGGEVASQNQVWLGSWYLENLNFHYLKNIDFEYHKNLRKPLAKSLYALLDIGFFANSHIGCYSKNYQELCTFLSINEFKQLSRIKQQLDPAHLELKQKGDFLSKWEYKESKKGAGFNIVWYPGSKYYADQKTRKDRQQIALNFKPGVSKDGSDTMMMVKYFQEQMNNIKDYKPLKNELTRANDLLEKCSGDIKKATSVIDYSIREMKKTKFQAKNFGAVMGYVGPGLNSTKNIQKNEKKESKRKGCKKCNGTGFYFDEKGSAVKCRHE
jgi:hypothetical protein